MKKNNIFKSLVMIFLYLFLSVLFSYVHLKLKIVNVLIDNIVLSIESLLILIIIWTFFKNHTKGKLKDFIHNYKKYIKQAFKYWGIGFTAMMISNFIINILFLDGLAPNEAANREILSSFPLYSILSMCFIGPMTEELLFRLNFKNVFKKRLSYILGTGIIFGAMHVVLSLEGLADLLYLIPYSALGIAFGACYYDTDNIYTSMFIHIFHNTFTILIIILGL